MPDDRPQEAIVPAATRPSSPADPSPDLDTLYRAHSAAVLSAAYRVTGDAAEAEDVLQTVFMRLLHRDGPPDLSPSPGAYLKRAAVNAAIDVVRRRSTTRRVSLDLVEPVLEDRPGRSPGEALRVSELKDWLRAAIGRVSPAAAEVFSLHYFEELDHTAIAHTLDITTNAVAVLLHRARKQLRADLEGAQGEIQ